MDDSLKWPRFNTVRGLVTRNALWKLGEVFLLRIWLYFYFPIMQDDHLTAGAWVTCALTRILLQLPDFTKRELYDFLLQDDS